MQVVAVIFIKLGVSFTLYFLFSTGPGALKTAVELFVRRQDRLRRNKRADKIVGVDAFFRGMNGYTMRREGREPDSIVQSCALRKKEDSFTQLNVTHYSRARGIKSFESCFQALLKHHEKDSATVTR